MDACVCKRAVKALLVLLAAMAMTNCGGGPDTSGTAPTRTDAVLGASSPANPVSLENAKLGSLAWKLDNPATAHEIEGYASLTSVNRGGSIDFMVSTSAPFFNVDIYRMGWYGGAGARLMTSFVNLIGKPQPVPCLNPSGVIECNWPASFSLAVPNDTSDASSPNYWASGVYLAKLSTGGGVKKDSYIIFVVRDDARTATYVSQLPVTTYQAYNYWGGKSLYTGCESHDMFWNCADGSVHATSVSFNRPYGKSSNPAAASGVGAGEFLTNVQPVAEGAPISSAGFDYNMLRWMEKQGYDIKYITNMDLHENAAVLAQAKAFVSTGHDEYYSKPMWDNLVAAKGKGINLAFFSSNQIFWQVRFADGSFGSNKKNRIMICYRGGGDPVTDNNTTTDQFRYLGRPEASLIGNQYVTQPVTDGVTITNPAHWLFAGSGAANGGFLAGLLGYEINAVVPGTSPAQTRVLAHSTSGGNASDMTYYVDASSAQVFATGTMQWSWGLDGYIPGNLRPDYTSAIAQAMTANVFDAFAERNLATFTNGTSALDLSTPSGNLDAAQTVQNPAPPGILKDNQWRLVPSGDQNYYFIVARATGLCLDAYGQDDGVPAGTWDCHGGDNQKWLLADQGNGNVLLIEKRTGRCLDDPARSTAPGTQLIIWTCHGGLNQQWLRRNLPS